MKEDIYVSLDEARNELKKRWTDESLKKAVLDELGDNFMKDFEDGPYSVLFRQICPADNGFVFFYQCSKYINASPLILEYRDDIFVHFNEEKKGLGRLRVVLEDKSKALVDIMDFHENEKNKLGDIRIKTGEHLIDFHHNFFKILKCQIDLRDNSKWFKNIGSAERYYYYFLLHFLAHGVLFDVFQTDEDDEKEDVFTKNVVLPTIKKIKERFKINPLIVRLYPEDQNEEEDFYWWCYPPNINDFIVNYAKENNIVLKKI